MFEYLVTNDPELRAFKNKVRFNDQILEEKALYLCFKKDAAGKAARTAFNEGLGKINCKAMQIEYMKTLH